EAPDDPCQAVPGHELPGEAHQRELQHDEEETAPPEERRNLAKAAPAEKRESRSGPGEEEEGGSAEGGHPAREKERQGGVREILGRKVTVSDEVADVVQRHQHHRRAPDQIYRDDPR